MCGEVVGLRLYRLYQTDGPHGDGLALPAGCGAGPGPGDPGQGAREGLKKDTECDLRLEVILRC